MANTTLILLIIAPICIASVAMVIAFFILDPSTPTKGAS